MCSASVLGETPFRGLPLTPVLPVAFGALTLVHVAWMSALQLSLANFPGTFCPWMLGLALSHSKFATERRACCRLRPPRPRSWGRPWKRRAGTSCSCAAGSLGRFGNGFRNFPLLKEYICIYIYIYFPCWWLPNNMFCFFFKTVPSFADSPTPPSSPDRPLSTFSLWAFRPVGSWVPT